MPSWQVGEGLHQLNCSWLQGPTDEEGREASGLLQGCRDRPACAALLCRCCLPGADEMGLGKTLQTISFLAYLKFNRQVEVSHPHKGNAALIACTVYLAEPGTNQPPLATWA